MKLWVVDAFCDHSHRGNPAGVCLLEHWPENNLLRHIAAEINLSETAFICPTKGQFQLRWFSPRCEIELCGHATLASAAVIWRENIAPPNHPVLFHTRNDVLTLYQTPPLIHLRFPLMPPIPTVCPIELINALGLLSTDLAYTGKNQSDWLIELHNPDRLSKLQPDFHRLETLLSGGIIITARDPSGAYDFISRYFDPAEGIYEDPVTGSAHCCLGPYWQSRLNKNTLIACQISKRGGVLHLTLFSDHIDIAGQIAFFMEGRIL